MFKNQLKTKYAEKLKDAGIFSLMDDLGNAISNQKNKNEVIMMGGGNPASIPEFEKIARKRLNEIANSVDLSRDFFGKYAPPEGNTEFLDHIANLFNKQYGWKLKRENICLSSGSQSAFYMLFNLLAGTMEDGSFKKIMLPLAPEYIGYNDSGFEHNLIVSNLGKIEKIGDHHFKYHIDFDALDLSKNDIGTLCISRPTNPTSNVISDYELNHLVQLSKKNNIPLIIDNAYGLPFPAIIHTEVNPVFDDHIILSMSLSKIGLPALRTGITIGNEEFISQMRKANAILSLAPPSTGSVIVNDWFKSGEIINIAQKIVKPFYANKAIEAEKILKQELNGLPYRLHKVEGGLFFWIWFENLPISSKELYQRLKEKGVIVVAGEYFFTGITNQDPHQKQCIRVNYSYDLHKAQKGFQIMAEILKGIYDD